MSRGVRFGRSELQLVACAGDLLGTDQVIWVAGNFGHELGC